MIEDYEAGIGQKPIFEDFAPFIFITSFLLLPKL